MSSAAAKSQRRAAKGSLTKAIGRLNDSVLENFSAQDIQTKIDAVKDALENSIDKNESFKELCEDEQTTPDDAAAEWDTAETARVEVAVKEAIIVMRALKVAAEGTEQRRKEAEAKVNQERTVTHKKTALQRHVAALRDSFTHFDKLVIEVVESTTLEAFEKIMTGQMETIEVALRELSESVDDANREASEVSELNLLLNEKRMRLIKHIADFGAPSKESKSHENDVVIVTDETNLRQESEPVGTNKANSSKESSEQSVAPKTPTSKGSEESSSGHASSIDTGKMLRMKVHATEPPKFEGSIYGWPTFVSTWKKVIEPITPVDMRAHVLRCNLKGEALKLVEACDDDYDEMLQRLGEEFGDPRKVTEVILASLRVKPLRDENTKGFIEYVDLLEKADEKLRKLDLLHEISNSQVLGDIERRLPPKARSEWAKLICEKRDSDLTKPYQFLISFLKEQRKQIKYLTSVIRAPSSPTTTASHFQGLQMENDEKRPSSEKEEKKDKDKGHVKCYNCGKEGHVAIQCDNLVEYFSCACCKSNDHPNVNCDVFKGLRAKERHAAIRNVRACFICFGAHPTPSCPKKDKHCGVCGKPNHSDLLCFKSESTSNGFCKSNQISGAEDEYLTSAGTNSDTLLHIMRINGVKKGTSLNAFFDDGSKGNFITHEAARRHNCPSVKMTVDVSLLNDVVETLETVKYKVGVRDKTGRIHYIYAYGTEKVTGEISQLDMKVITKVFPNMTEAQLKALQRPVGDVDILIGNFYSDWQPTRKKSKGHLSIMSCLFGVCLSGSHPELRVGPGERKLVPDYTNERTAVQRVGVSTHSQLVSTRHGPHNREITHQVSQEAVVHECIGNQHSGDTGKQQTTVSAHAQASSVRSKFGPNEKEERDSFFRAENLGVEVTPKCGECKCGDCPIAGHTYSFREEQELQLIREGCSYDPDKCVWTASYPFLVSRDSLPYNYVAALAILRRLERNLLKDPEWRKVYSAQIQDMIDRKAARLVTQEELDKWKGAKHFITHLAAVNPKSKTTPVRICFNSSQKFYGPGGTPISLNSCLAKGPDAYLNNILGILCRFREENTAIQGDIRKMYNSVLLSLEDQMVHLFLWRSDASQKPDVYAVCVVNIGDRPAGAIATECAYMTADMYSKEFPLAAATIKDSSYVDDVVDSVNGIQNAKRLASEVSYIYGKANMHIKEWIFSGDTVNEEESVPIGTECDKSRVLGVLWKPASDVLTFEVKINFSEKKRKIRTGPDVLRADLEHQLPIILTRRIVMAQVMTIFDPQGLIAPVTITARFLLRKTWSLKIGWDDDLGSDLRNEWLEFFKRLYEVSNLTFKRCLRPEGVIGNPQLIIFSDGSDIAYGAAAYVRWTLASGKYQCALVMGKGRILPLQKMSIPRSETNGGVVSKRLRCFLEKEMRYEFSEVIQFVDSKTVLGMLNRTSRRFSLYMGSRIGEIQSASKVDENGRLNEWRWIPGNQNVADIITRGATPDLLGPESVWQNGPDFLYRHREEWPDESEFDEKLPPEAEERTVVTVMSANVTKRDRFRTCMEYFSRLCRLLNTVVRIIKILRPDEEGNYFYPLSKAGLAHCKAAFETEITAGDLEEARLFCVRKAQEEMIDELKKPNGRYRRLAPVWDDQERVYRVGERLRAHVPFTYDQQLPILLPQNHPFAILNMWDAHEECHQGATGGTLVRFRRRYWTPQGGKLAKRIKGSCVTCRKLDLQQLSQKMGPIPEHLLVASPAFTFTGLDLFGPLQVRGFVNKRTTRKAYGVLFVCLMSGAVHIDAADDYSTSGFLQVLRRFGSLRGWPKKLYSDNGSQLSGGSNVLKEIWDNIDQKAIKEFAATRGFEWTFPPADSPWRQGKMERLIGVAKRCMKVAVGDTRLSITELLTVLCEVMQLMNQRPIAMLAKEDGESRFLCPNDLLLGRASPETPSMPWNYKSKAGDRFKIVQSVVDSFWQRWMVEYAPNLVIRQKWHVSQRNVAVGDVVMIADSNSLRGQYRTATVEQVKAGSDGKVRSCTLKYKIQKAGADYKGSKYAYVDRSVQRLVMVLPAGETGDVLEIEDIHPPIVDDIKACSK